MKMSLVGIDGDKMRPITNDVLLSIENLEVIEPDKIVPIEFRVLLRIAECKAKVGNVLKPASVLEKEIFGRCTATLVSMGNMAFTDASGNRLSDAPKPGDKVMTAKYAGITVRDDAYNLYRVCNDKDVTSIVKE
jgi:co-chaperonin GroES (HSP10)